MGQVYGLYFDSFGSYRYQPPRFRSLDNTKCICLAIEGPEWSLVKSSWRGGKTVPESVGVSVKNLLVCPGAGMVTFVNNDEVKRVVNTKSFKSTRCSNRILTGNNHTPCGRKGVGGFKVYHPTNGIANGCGGLFDKLDTMSEPKDAARKITNHKRSNEGLACSCCCDT